MRQTNTYRMLASLILCSIAMATVNTRAAVAPRSPEDLAKKATHIVSGKVVKVTSKTQKSKIERAIGIHRDRIFTIKLMVTRVSKGAGVKAGDLIEIVAWQPSLSDSAISWFARSRLHSEKG